MKEYKHTVPGFVGDGIRVFTFTYSNGVFTVELMPDTDPTDIENVSEASIEDFCARHDLDYSSIAGKLAAIK